MPEYNPQLVDSLIHAKWVIPVDAADSVLQDHAVAINDNRIIDVLPSAEATERYQANNTFELSEHALIPGLINAHGHAAMTLMRGLADDLPLMEWLNEHIWPAEQRLVCDEFVATGTELAIAEMLLSGTTCFSDMYFFPDVVARVSHQHKIRAEISPPILEFPSAWASNAAEYIEKALKVRDNYRNHELIQVGFGPHAPYTVSDESLTHIGILANELDASIQIHLHETAQEITDAEANDSPRPLQRLADLNLLSPRLQCVHMTQTNDDDIALLREYGCHVIHCPESNLKLASGICPTTKLLNAGINVALGTDGAASNNDLDMFGEMKAAALLAKGFTKDATALPASQALRMATINGAKALGIDKITGSLEIGKAADMVAVNLDAISMQPVYNPVSQLVYSHCGQQVSYVWVNGELLVNEQQLTGFDLNTLKTKIAGWRDKITDCDNH